MYEQQANSNTIDFMKAPGGTISLNLAGKDFPHRSFNDHYTPTELFQHSVEVVLKDDDIMRHKTIPTIDILATRFADDILNDMPKGPNRIDFNQFRTWLAIQFDELNHGAPVTPPAAPYPVSIIPKIKSHSLRDPDSELSFHQAGFICYREESCIPPFFNIEQQLWPYRQVSMDWITTTEAFFTLAANILHAYEGDQETSSAPLPINPSTFAACSSFVTQFIDPMPYHGGHIPLQQITLWLETNGTP